MSQRNLTLFLDSLLEHPAIINGIQNIARKIKKTTEGTTKNIMKNGAINSTPPQNAIFSDSASISCIISDHLHILILYYDYLFSLFSLFQSFLNTIINSIQSTVSTIFKQFLKLLIHLPPLMSRNNLKNISYSATSSNNPELTKQIKTSHAS